MSNDMSVTGVFSFDPPLTWAELRSVNYRKLEKTLKFDLRTEEVDTDEGKLDKITAIGVEARYPEQGQYSFPNFEVLADHFPDRMAGHLDCVYKGITLHDCTIDGVFRLVPLNGRLVELVPRIRWVPAMESEQ